MRRTWRIVIATFPKPWWEPEYDFWHPALSYWRPRCTANESFVRKICGLICFVDDIRRRRWQERKRFLNQRRLPFGRVFRLSFTAMMFTEYTEQYEKQLAADGLVDKAVTEATHHAPASMLDLPITLGPLLGSLN